jgi:hypothetical protein
VKAGKTPPMNPDQKRGFFVGNADDVRAVPFTAYDDARHVGQFARNQADVIANVDRFLLGETKSNLSSHQRGFCVLHRLRVLIHSAASE